MVLPAFDPNGDLDCIFGNCDSPDELRWLAGVAYGALRAVVDGGDSARSVGLDSPDVLFIEAEDAIPSVRRQAVFHCIHGVPVFEYADWDAKFAADLADARAAVVNYGEKQLSDSMPVLLPNCARGLDLRSDAARCETFPTVQQCWQFIQYLRLVVKLHRVELNQGADALDPNGAMLECDDGKGSLLDLADVCGNGDFLLDPDRCASDCRAVWPPYVASGMHHCNESVALVEFGEDVRIKRVRVLDLLSEVRLHAWDAIDERYNCLSQFLL